MMKIMQYPIFLAFFLIIMILIFNRILLPQVDMVYSSFGSTAPLFTEQILSAIKLLPYLIFSTIFIVTIGCSLYIFYFRKLPHMKQVKIMLLVKTFLILKHSHYFATQLSGLLHGGLSVLEALTIMMEQKYHPFFDMKRVELNAN